MTISIWRYSHLLLALVSSVFIIIASVTGAIIAFEPISETLNPYKIEGVEQVYLKQTVAALKQNYDEVIELKTDYNQFVSAQVITKGGDFLSGYIHPLTGAYLGPEIQKKPLFKLFGRSGPPAANVAPSLIPALIKFMILSYCVFDTTGPMWSPFFDASSTLIRFASSAASLIDFS